MKTIKHKVKKIQTLTIAEFIYNPNRFLPDNSWPGDIITVWASMQEVYHIYKYNTNDYWERVYY